MSEIVLQEGALRDLPLLDLILLARGSQGPTILELKRGGTTRRFYFRDATIVAFTTTNKREGLTTYLVRRKKLPVSVAESIDAVASQDGLTPAQAILRDRILPIPELAKELTSWTSLLLVQAFSWIDGQFRLLAESPDQAPPETLFELTLSSAIVQGVWKRMPIEEVRSLVTPYFDFQAGTGANPAFKITDFRLSPDRLRLWEELRQARSLRAALRATLLEEEDALRCVYMLHRTGLIDLMPAVSDVDDDLADFGFADEEVDLEGWLDDLGELPADPAPEEEYVDKRTEPAPWESPAMQMRRPAPKAPQPQTSGIGVDLSSIGFRRAEGSATTSSTYHAASGLREKLGTGRHKSVDPDQVETRTDAQPVEDRSMPDNPLSGLFADMDFEARPKPSHRRPVAPPRGGSPGGWRHERSSSSRKPEGDPSSPPGGPRPTEPSDLPPTGRGPAIEEFDWARLPTKEKDRIRGLRTMLADFEGKNYFEYFELSPESSPSLIKKAYFKMARRFHPDALVDESDLYRRHAEAVFTVISEAYEVLSEDESRDKYTRKHVHGEKDENDLAMERVQELLAAESAYRGGIRLLNQGKLGKAVELLSDAVERDPEEAEYRGWLGFAQFRASQHVDYERALAGEQMLMQAIAAKPAVATLPHLMGKIAMQRKDWGSAKKWLRKSLKLKADNPEAVREYKRIDELTKSGRSSDDGKSGGLKSLFGRFGKK